MGAQGIISPSTELDDARFDAIVGISREERGDAPAPRDARLSTPGLSPRARRRRAVVTLSALLGAGALIAGTLLVTSGTLSFSERADKLAGATSPMSEAAAPEAPAHTAVFGTAANLSDGVSVLVSAPTGYEPGRKAVGATQAENLVYTVTVTNTSDLDLTPALAVAASAGGVAGTPITESAEGLTRPGSATIAAGASRTFRVAFSTASADTVVTVSGSGGSVITFHA